jgi:hypothetical protein
MLRGAVVSRRLTSTRSRSQPPLLSTSRMPKSVANLIGLREELTISGRNDGLNNKTCTRLAQAVVTTSYMNVISNRESCVSRLAFVRRMKILALVPCSASGLT